LLHDAPLVLMNDVNFKVQSDECQY
jgi:hypothetical protein